jgi:hypothetical protein
LKFTRHVPAAVKMTVLPLNEQPDELLESVRTTLSPDVAVAPGVYEPRTLPADGGVLSEMVFDEWTVMLWVTWAAAA